MDSEASSDCIVGLDPEKEKMPIGKSLYLSKTRFIKGLQCLKALYLDRHHPEMRGEIPEFTQALLAAGIQVGLVARQLFPGGVTIPYEGLSGEEQLFKTQESIRQGAVTLYEAAFRTDDVFIKADILTRREGGWAFYEVKASSNMKEHYLNDVALQHYVIAGSGLSLQKASLVHINTQYVRCGDIELEKLFSMEDLTERVQEKKNFVREQIVAMRGILSSNETPDIDIGDHCNTPYDCEFKAYCWRHVPPDSVFDLRGRGVRAADLYRQGMVHLGDIPLGILKGPQRMQVEAFLEKKEFINQGEVKAFLNSLWYPRCFLDFETFQNALPPFDGTRPYQQIPFQYSLHVLGKKGEEVRHFEFLAEPGRDPRKEFLETLLSNIPSGACVLAFNASYEKMILEALMEWYPEYRIEVEALVKNVIDLAEPFRKRFLYRWQMRGSSSLKDILPAMVPEMSYANLEIHDGAMASQGYHKMNQIKDPEELEKVRTALREYCRLDSLSLVKILEEMERIAAPKLKPDMIR